MARHLVLAALGHASRGDDEAASLGDTDKAGRQFFGSFTINDAVFHVAPRADAAMVESCRQDLLNGSRVFLFVRAKSQKATRDLTKAAGIDARILLGSIESVLGVHLMKRAGFETARLGAALEDLIKAYNRRIRDNGGGSAPFVKVHQAPV